MKKFSMKLKRLVRRWLGLGESFIGVDMGYRDQSCVVVVSRLNNGAVRIIDCRFESVREMENLVRVLQQRYGIPNKSTFVDMPHGMRWTGKDLP